jgi:hypothetical protein
LRFQSKENPEHVKYRLIVLSRNLTFDRSWDLAAVIDGEVRKQNRLHNKSLLNFFDELSSLAKQSGRELSLDRNEVMLITWQNPDDIDKIEFFSTAFSGSTKTENTVAKIRPKPIKFNQEHYKRLLVMSPFILGGRKVSGLNSLAKYVPNCKRYLFGRAEEFNNAGKTLLKDWQCYALNEKIIDAEDMEEVDKKHVDSEDNSNLIVNSVDRNIHAKLIVMEEFQGQSTWHLGSANATEAAIGSDVGAPRNSEFMLKLRGAKQKLGVGELLKHLTSKDNSGLFVKHEFDESQLDVAETSSEALRLLVFQLINASYNLLVNLSDEDSFTLTLNCDEIPISGAFDIRVSTLAVDQFRPLSKELIWQHLKLVQISALVKFHILKEGKVVEQLVTQIPLRFNCKVNRENAIVNDLVKDSSQFISYLSMMLNTQPETLDLFRLSEGLGKASKEKNFFEKDGVVFEKLMQAAANNPTLLSRIETLKQKLDPNVIPDDFESLWRVFSHFVPRD